MSYNYYLKFDYSTPECFLQKCSEKSSLIIGTGPSTKKILKYLKYLKDIFDVIIGVNFAIVDFEYILDFHMVMENKPTGITDYFKKIKSRKDLPRIFNYMSLRWLPKDLNIYKAIRWNFSGRPDVRKYKTEDGEGLFAGYHKKQFSNFGCVSLQALHFAGILGCSKAYTIGMDFVFGKDQKYYLGYTGKDHKKEITDAIVIPKNIVDVELNGEKRQTYYEYKETAEWMNRFIKEECVPNGMGVYDFSGGLLMEAKQLDIDEFMEGVEEDG